MSFARGVPTSSTLGCGPLDASLDGPFTSGTSVTFLPDARVFKGSDGLPCVTFEADRLVGRMDELAYLNPGLRMVLEDARADPPEVREFSHEGGLAEYAELLCKSKTSLIGGEEKAKAAAKKAQER